jgi:hypothetical protein
MSRNDKITLSATKDRLMKLGFAILLGQYYYSPKVYEAFPFYEFEKEKNAHERVSKLMPTLTINSISLGEFHDFPTYEEDNSSYKPDGERYRTALFKLNGENCKVRMELRIAQSMIDGHECQWQCQNSRITIVNADSSIEKIAIWNPEFDIFAENAEAHYRNNIGNLIDSVCYGNKTFVFMYE